ncbi:hypothetical protein [uncultured Pseudomonas sp.]|uniref:hypothetical protein n=1 Tax=uncultured Pseudomonas sp. TaxID=114707 RepID=UPI0025D59B2C|nr:hypothetical protein [uncultured Pseudomonas sp.]
MQPEHLDSGDSLFLPIANETCEILLSAEGAQALIKLTNPELAAVLVIQHLAENAGKSTPYSIEKILAKLIAWSIDSKKPADSSLLSEAQRLFSQKKLHAGLNNLKNIKIILLTKEEVEEADYLASDGTWDFNFKIRIKKKKIPFSEQMVTPRFRELWLSPAQDRLVRIFRANLGEDIHVQGYAGIGKSHLLGALIDYLPPYGTLLLAKTTEKLVALHKRMEGRGKKPGFTFEALAKSLLPNRDHPTKNPSTSIPNKGVLAKQLNILGIQDYDERTTLDICLKVIANYCFSSSHTLSKSHLPDFRLPLSHLEAKVLLQYSITLWSYIQSNPAWDKKTGFPELVMIKRAAVEGCTIPSRYTHVLIDESQDTPDSLLQIIKRGRQVLITLGDEYQQAKHKILTKRRDIRQSEISQSVRSGRNIEKFINPLINRHSKKIKTPFEGISDTDICIKHYPLDFAPPEGCVIMTASYWDTLKWAIELSEAHRPIQVANKESQEDLMSFISSAVKFFKPDYYSPNDNSSELHFYFNEFKDWQQLHHENQFDESFLWAEKKLENGFNVSDANRIRANVGQSNKGYLLMMAEMAGGTEFDNILLTPALLTTEKLRNTDEFDQRICAVYIAISRTKRNLYIPYDVIEWVEYHNNNKFRELSGF